MKLSWIKLLLLALILFGQTVSFAQPCSDAERAKAAISMADMPDCHKIANADAQSFAKSECALQSLAEKGLSKASFTDKAPHIDPIKAVLPAPAFTSEPLAQLTSITVQKRVFYAPAAPPIYLTTQRFRI